MSWLITKYLVTAGLVVAISEFAKRSDKLGGLIAALPFVTILTLIWLHIEQQPQEKITYTKTIQQNLERLISCIKMITMVTAVTTLVSFYFSSKVV